MIVGASYPIHAGATWAMLSGSAHADFGVENLGDPKAIAAPFRAAASGAIAFKGTLPANQTAEFFALARHNAADGATYRLRFYSDAALSTLVDDSGTKTFDVPGVAFATTTPYRLAAPQSVRAVRVDLSDIGVAWQIGAAILAGFWDLTAHDARALGLKDRDAVSEVGDGVRRGTRQWSPRAYSLGNSLIDWTTDGQTFHDFQRAMLLSEPFVWVRDYGDPDTWARECDLVRNQALPPLGKDAYVFGSLALDMISHLAGN